ncbi:helicase [Leucobacter soli]|uniref:Helicase n=1 Tax=Leucobacter soli TaxID=2812850 RepID=A0A916JZ18_9MICO|nr:helicase [Leucobacter soli]CAG7617300.1 hypothetical protein LEUCIP111803_02085 [Leucobacter soli]
MSAPAVAACCGAVLALALPVVVATGSIDAAHRVAGAADAAALAAADAHAGWVDGAPCDLAEEVLVAVGARVDECLVDEVSGRVRLQANLPTMLGTARARAHAGPPFP